ncbi:hypothetical protein A2714_01680 [Candidatus Woesebacteria bacterium RIFCSPHIGHO2_01_FULL_38_9]|uniref:Uncharacterized protein n=2 Tax=Candidatus Woeseibacteriota TaxID=1752722 RepID=A0A1F7XZC4_9BACT|nr:MAG: hypothetical protein A2714_01680 [Candidatus Woesebacteria bacterium RIFCSPHIGHO2_01_FULL_38_9]OGM59356.1 MAG: hypothetical protein A3A75_03325 [Candidatus Woesebacteria bacterium RIFCSPLOWO2_01_FULL_39_10]
MSNAIPTETSLETEASAETLVSPAIQQIKEADAALSNWMISEDNRIVQLAQAKAEASSSLRPHLGQSLTELETPVAKDKQVLLGERIAQGRLEVENVCDKAFGSGAKDKDKQKLQTLKDGLTSARKEGEDPDPETLAKAIQFVQSNANSRRSWGNVADILKVYPEALQDQSFREQVVSTFRQEIIHQGPQELARPAESRVIGLMVNEKTLDDVTRSEVSGWKNHIEGFQLYSKVRERTKIKANTLDASDVATLLGEGFDVPRVQKAMNELKIYDVIPDTFGQITARLSRSEGIKDEDREELRMKALGYAAGALKERPDPQSQAQEYQKTSVGVAKTLTELAGADTSVYDIKKGNDQFSREFVRVWDKINSSDAEQVFQAQNLEVVNNKARAIAEDPATKKAKETAEERLKEEKEKVVKGERIKSQKEAAVSFNSDARIQGHLETLSDPNINATDRQKAKKGLEDLKDKKYGADPLAVDLALKVATEVDNLLVDLAPDGNQDSTEETRVSTGFLGFLRGEDRWRLTSGTITDFQKQLNEIQGTDDFKNGEPDTVARHYALRRVVSNLSGGYWTKDKNSGNFVFQKEEKKDLG